MKITIINGPNLNLLGTRETDIYGSQNFESYLNSLKASFPKITIDYFQSNIEGEIVTLIQQAKRKFKTKRVGGFSNHPWRCFQCRQPRSGNTNTCSYR